VSTVYYITTSRPRNSKKSPFLAWRKNLITKANDSDEKESLNIENKSKRK
jgi:hypothetical protein